MKRIILSSLALLLGFGIVAAQSPSNSKQPAVKTEKKEVKAVPAPKQAQPVKAVVPTSATKPAVKQEVSPATNPKANEVSGTKADPNSTPRISPAGPTTKTKKDGTPDKRYKENKNLKKDGTPDMRYKENKPASPKNDGTKKK
jgi:hypothetical protein